MSDEHLRQRVADGREYLEIGFVGERLIEAGVVQRFDASGDARLRVPKHGECAVLGFINILVCNRHASGAKTLCPIIRQPGANPITPPKSSRLCVR